MARKLRSPTRTLSNSGEREQFIGEFPCSKSTTSPLVFDSIPALYCAIYLEWRKDVVRMEFEPRWYKFTRTADLPALRAIPDFDVVLDTGEEHPVEAKSSLSKLSAKEQAKLQLLKQHCDAQGRTLEVVYRDVLERSGFIDTVLLLRRFGLLRVTPEAVRAALARIREKSPATLAEWRRRALEGVVPTGLLYYLLYHQELPLVCEPLLSMELTPCRV